MAERARTNLPCIAALAISTISSSRIAHGDCISGAWLTPSQDRWNYPFNTTPGTKPDAKVFGAFTETGLSPDFDNRDGQMVIGFDTADQVPAGLPVNDYTVLAATVTVMVESEDTFLYDPTYDGWATYLHETDEQFVADEDAGRPVELFGTGFRDGFTRLTWTETTPYSATSAMGKYVRSAWPLGFTDSPGAHDVSNSVDEQIDALPFAIGIAPELSPGDVVPQLTTLTFELDVNHTGVQQHLRESVRDGSVQFSIASMFSASQQVDGTFPEFFTKESAAVEFDLANAATLTLNVHIGRPGDVDGSGTVDVSDLLTLLGSWGSCGDCAADTNCDGLVNVQDLLTLLGDWG